jgi:predicted AAA+ superfamily ATPase
LIRILAAQVGFLLNKSELADTLKIRFETVFRYLDSLERDFYLSFTSSIFSKRAQKVSKNPKSTGSRLWGCFLRLRRLFNAYEAVSGHEVGNFVFQELIEQFPLEDINFYRIRGDRIRGGRR